MCHTQSHIQTSWKMFKNGFRICYNLICRASAIVLNLYNHLKNKKIKYRCPSCFLTQGRCCVCVDLLFYSFATGSTSFLRPLTSLSLSLFYLSTPFSLSPLLCAPSCAVSIRIRSCFLHLMAAYQRDSNRSFLFHAVIVIRHSIYSLYSTSVSLADDADT